MKSLVLTLFLFIAVNVFGQHATTSIYAVHHQTAQAEWNVTQITKIKVSDNFIIPFQSFVNQDVELVMYDNQDKIVWRKKAKLKKGENQIKCSVMEIPNGMYKLYIQGEKHFQQMSVYVLH